MLLATVAKVIDELWRYVLAKFRAEEQCRVARSDVRIVREKLTHLVDFLVADVVPRRWTQAHALKIEGRC